MAKKGGKPKKRSSKSVLQRAGDAIGYAAKGAWDELSGRHFSDAMERINYGMTRTQRRRRLMRRRRKLLKRTSPRPTSRSRKRTGRR